MSAAATGSAEAPAPRRPDGTAAPATPDVRARVPMMRPRDGWTSTTGIDGPVCLQSLHRFDRVADEPQRRGVRRPAWNFGDIASMIEDMPGEPQHVKRRAGKPGRTIRGRHEYGVDVRAAALSRHARQAAPVRQCHEGTRVCKLRPEALGDPQRAVGSKRLGRDPQRCRDLSGGDPATPREHEGERLSVAG
jgi:hypothetical protein